METYTITDLTTALKASSKMQGVALTNSFGNLNLLFPSMQDVVVSQAAGTNGTVVFGELIYDKKRVVNFDKLNCPHLQTVVTQLIERKTSSTKGLFRITSEDTKALFLSAFLMLLESKRGLATGAKVIYETADNATEQELLLAKERAFAYANSNLLNFKIYHEILPILLDNEPLESVVVVRSGTTATASKDYPALATKMGLESFIPHTHTGYGVVDGYELHRDDNSAITIFIKVDKADELESLMTPKKGGTFIYEASNGLKYDVVPSNVVEKRQVVAVKYRFTITKA